MSSSIEQIGETDSGSLDEHVILRKDDVDHIAFSQTFMSYSRICPHQNVKKLKCLYYHFRVTWFRFQWRYELFSYQFENHWSRLCYAYFCRISVFSSNILLSLLQCRCQKTREFASRRNPIWAISSLNCRHSVRAVAREFLLIRFLLKLQDRGPKVYVGESI